MFYVSIFISTILLVCVVYNLYLDYIKHKNKISFKESLSLTKMPIISVELEDNTIFNFILDTGSEDNVIDKKIIQSVFNTELDTYGTTIGTTGISEAFGNVSVTFTISNTTFKEEFHVIDLSYAVDVIKERGITIHGILGNSFFKKHKYVLDFKDKIFYARKSIIGQ